MSVSIHNKSLNVVIGDGYYVDNKADLKLKPLQPGQQCAPDDEQEFMNRVEKLREEMNISKLEATGSRREELEAAIHKLMSRSEYGFSVNPSVNEPGTFNLYVMAIARRKQGGSNLIVAGTFRIENDEPVYFKGEPESPETGRPITELIRVPGNPAFVCNVRVNGDLEDWGEHLGSMLEHNARAIVGMAKAQGNGLTIAIPENHTPLSSSFDLKALNLPFGLQDNKIIDGCQPYAPDDVTVVPFIRVSGKHSNPNMRLAPARISIPDTNDNKENTIVLFTSLLIDPTGNVVCFMPDKYFEFIKSMSVKYDVVKIGNWVVRVDDRSKIEPYLPTLEQYISDMSYMVYTRYTIDRANATEDNSEDSGEAGQLLDKLKAMLSGMGAGDVVPGVSSAGSLGELSEILKGVLNRARESFGDRIFDDESDVTDVDIPGFDPEDKPIIH